MAQVQESLRNEQKVHAATAAKLGSQREHLAAKNISITQTKMRIRKLEANVKDLTTQLRNATSVRNYLQVLLILRGAPMMCPFACVSFRIPTLANIIGCCPC